MRVLPVHPLVTRGDGQQMEVVVAEDRDGGVAERLHFAQHGERVGAAVDEVADQPQPVAARREADERRAAGRARRGSPGCRRSRRGSCAGVEVARGKRSGLRRRAESHGDPQPTMRMINRGRFYHSSLAPPLPHPDVVPAQSRAARGGALPRRPAARPRRRRQRQDPRDHREDRPPDGAAASTPRRSPRSRSPTRRRARCASASASCWRGGQRRAGRRADGLDVPLARRAGSCAATRRALGLKPRFSILDPDDIEPHRRRARRSDATASGRAPRSGGSRVEERAGRARRRRRGSRRATTSGRRARLPRYDDTLRAYQAVDFDDLIAPAGGAARGGRRGARAKWRERCCATCSSTSTRTPIRRSTGCSGCWPATRAAFTAVGDDDQAIYGWRGATLDNLARLPDDYPALKVDQARAELPLDGAHPARRPTR